MNQINSNIKTLDVVALLRDHPELCVTTGHVGTVVEVLDDKTVEVEFITGNGETYAMGPLPVGDLLVLHYSPSAA